MDVKELEDIARRLRVRVLEMCCAAGGGHLGGAFSVMDVLVALYFNEVRDNDRVIFSKGHSCLALYNVLAECGRMPRKMLDQYCTDGGDLHGHPHKSVPGVEVSTGSLGHGLSLACGMAYADRSRRVFCIMGDGEMNEGSVWEALMFGSQHRLSNLTAIIDANSLMSLDTVDNILSIEPLEKRLWYFGWAVTKIDGHDLGEISRAISGPAYLGRPLAVVARTVKGKGVSFMENTTKWHYRCPTPEEREAALIELSPRQR